ncbi:hypothetical protein C8R47DRAFT_977287 [Mycena vitilis]|nr:hypothetical protein C8R47DRAFT_977287 [Mycena vitilis]
MPAVELDLPEDTPEWLMTALHYLTARDLGCHYTALLKALVRLEESAGFEETSHTALRSSTARPKEVGKYVKGARGAKMKALPEVKNVKAFATKWNAWWDDLQPKWRQRGADGQWITGGKYGDEWGGLDCAGPNGTLSVVAALYFWGSASTHTAETQAAWTAAVQDATWMLEGLDTLFE